MLHVFKNVTFSNVGCILCNEQHTSFDCPSLCSIVEMEQSSSASPNNSSSSSDSNSHSPNHDYSSCGHCYRNGSHSIPRSPRRFDRGYSPEIDYSQDRYYRYRSQYRNKNYQDRLYNLSYYDGIYNNSNGFSIGAIIRIVTQINIKTGHFQIITMVAIIGSDQITITTMVMIGTRGPNMLERVSPSTNISSIATIKLDEITMITRHRLMGMTGIWVMQTIILLPSSLMCQIL